jgi:putative hydrolase of the HAD superfamily
MHCKTRFTVTENSREGYGMHQIKAVIFDFIGTLTNVVDYDMENSKMKLAQAIIEAGFKTSTEEFLQAYSQAHEKYRVIRYEQLVEVTNAIWISEALNRLGFNTKQEDTKIKTAVNAFFEDYIETLELRPGADNLLKELAITHKLGLISNFTFAPVIFAGLKRLDINKYFNVILVSDETGWRKPNTKIFKEALRRLKVTAEETVYVGDSPQEDIKGAKAVGMKTVFVPSQFYTFKNLTESKQKPDLIAKDLCGLCEKIQNM